MNNWLLYVQDELDEQTREEYENHLYSCDDCLEIYLQAVEANELQMPSLPETADFTDSVMKQIQTPVKTIQKRNRKIKSGKDDDSLYVSGGNDIAAHVYGRIFTADECSQVNLKMLKRSKRNLLFTQFLNNSISITDSVRKQFQGGR